MNHLHTLCPQIEDLCGQIGQQVVMIHLSIQDVAVEDVMFVVFVVLVKEILGSSMLLLM